MPRFKQYKETEKISVDNFNMLMRYAEALAGMRVSGGKFRIDESGAALSVDTSEDAVVHLVYLTEDLATGSVDDPSTAAAQPYMMTAENEEAPPTVTVSPDDQFTVVNRSPDYSAKSGENILVISIDLDTTTEWQPLSGSKKDVIVNPPIVNQCSCDKCYDGVTLPDATQCCRGHLGWKLTNPWLDCTQLELTLTYFPNDQWITEVFDGPDGNQYRYLLTVSILGTSTLELVSAISNAPSEACLTYGREGFDCQCTNQFTLTKPWGHIAGIEYSRVLCAVCIQPMFPDTQETCGVPNAPELLLAAVSVNASADLLNLVPDDKTITLVWQDANTEHPFPYTADTCTLQDIDAKPVGWVAHYPTDYVTATYGVGSEVVAFLKCNKPRLDLSIGVLPGGKPGGVHHTQTDSRFDFSNLDGGVLNSFDIRTDVHLFVDDVCTNGSYPNDIGQPWITLFNTYVTPLRDVTTSGACADQDLSMPNAPSNPEGYCCIDSQCLDYLTETYCNDFQGTWYDTGSCPADCASLIL